MLDDSLLALVISPGAVLSIKVSYSLNCFLELNLTARLLLQKINQQSLKIDLDKTRGKFGYRRRLTSYSGRKQRANKRPASSRDSTEQISSRQCRRGHSHHSSWRLCSNIDNNNCECSTSRRSKCTLEKKWQKVHYQQPNLQPPTTKLDPRHLDLAKSHLALFDLYRSLKLHNHTAAVKLAWASKPAKFHVNSWARPRRLSFHSLPLQIQLTRASCSSPQIQRDLCRACRPRERERERKNFYYSFAGASRIIKI